MAILRLAVLNKENQVLLENQCEDEVTLSYHGLYQPGDKICLQSDRKHIYLKIRLDDSLEASYVYLQDFTYLFEIPFENGREPYGEKSFTEEQHWGYASVIDEKEFHNYRNLAHNAFDVRGNQVIFPHTETNTGTTNPQFFERNAIDGVFESSLHGSWPYNSWGINQRSDAWLKIDFGNDVLADQVIIYLRADFPHDNWWEKVKLSFSDNSSLTIHLRKTGKAQRIRFDEKRIRWIKLSDLMMSNENSKFPALSQIMVMGRFVDSH